MIVKCASCGSQNRIPPAKLDRQARCGSCKEALSPAVEPYAVSNATEFAELISQSSLPVLVDFWAPWCGPCRVVGPELAKLARQRNGSILVAKLNTEEVPEIASRFGIQGIPTFILFRGGREVSRASGAMPAPQIERTLGL